MARMPSNITLEEHLGRLPHLSRTELVAQWIDVRGTGPPKGISRKLMCLGIAYELQAQRYYPLKPNIVRRLHDIAKGAAVGKDAFGGAAKTLKEGTRLIREWNDTTHVVDVVENGYAWQGETYSSLSAIARAITGARWSGPRFFGVGSGGS